MLVLEVINLYLKDVEFFIQSLDKKLLGNPLAAVKRGMLHKKGILNTNKGNVAYNFHGRGCEFTIENRTVDFDFGVNSRSDGFDLWRLIRYSKYLDSTHPVIAEEVLTKDFKELIERNLISKSGDELDPLYYLTKNI